MDLFNKIVDFLKQNGGFFNKIVDLCSEIVDFLFERGVLPHLPNIPGYGPGIYKLAICTLIEGGKAVIQGWFQANRLQVNYLYSRSQRY